MPWGAAIAAVGALGGGYLASEGAKDAAKTQVGAAGDATGVQSGIFTTTNAQQQPFIGAGYGALSTLNRLLGTSQPIYADQIPGYTGPGAAAPQKWGENNGRLIGDTWLPPDVQLEDQGKGWYRVNSSDGTYLGNLRPGGKSGRFENVGAAVPTPRVMQPPMQLPGGGELIPRDDQPMTNPNDKGIRIPGGMKPQAAMTQSAGRAGDDYLVHVNKDELGQMHDAWGKPSVNPNTGLREYGFWSRIKNALTDPESVGSTMLDPAGGTIRALTGQEPSTESLLDPGGLFSGGDDGGGGGGGGGGTSSGNYGMRVPVGYTPDNTGLPDGYLTQTFGPEQFKEGIDPGYQWRMQQGMQGVMNSTAPTYGALSGPALKALIDYGQGSASQEFGSAFNRFQTQQGNIFQRLSSIANLGQNAAAGVGQQGTAVGGNIGANIVGAGNAGAAGQVGSANAWSGALSDLGSLAWLQSQGGG